MNLDASVIVSTYNQPQWLEKVLWSYEQQSSKDFEIVIADDGSGNETKRLIDDFIVNSNLNIRHVWHEDDGFQKTKILNKAILETSSEYLIFTDGDCIARADMVETHLNLREKGSLLSGGYYKLPMNISQIIGKSEIETQCCFDVKWLKGHGLKSSFKNNKISAGPFKASVLNAITTTKATWDGNNSSGWKADILSVNGFDERMQYGGEDRELGERMFNMGIKGKQIRYSSICLHLDHDRGYVKPEMIVKNSQIRTVTKKNKLVWTEYGIMKH